VIASGALLAGCHETAEDQRATEKENSATATVVGVEGTAPTAREIVKRMFTAYHAADSYADSGRMREQAVVQGQNHDATPMPFEVTFQRPNRLRARILETTVVSDGKILQAAIDSLPGQVLEVPAPATTNMSNFPPDELLREALKGGRDIFSAPQLSLLLAESPAEAAEKLAATASLLAHDTCDGRSCFRVQFQGPGGNHIYWIDKESYILRRVDLPTEELAKGLDPAENIKDLKVWIELNDARIGAKIDDQAYAFEVPEGARRLTHFVTPVPGPRPERIGDTIGDFGFTAVDGSTVDRKSLDGKLTVLDFWFQQCGFCKISMPALEKVHQRFKDNDRVQFFAVNTDEPGVSNQQLAETLQAWGTTIPLVRDLKGHGMERLNVYAAPTTILLDASGKVQRYQQGFHADYSPLGDAIERLLAGDDPAAQALEAYEAELRDFETRLEAASVKSNQAAAGPVDAAQAAVEDPPVEIPPRSEPQVIKLEKLWQVPDLKKPGNILVITAENQPPRFVVLDGFRTVVEVDSGGNVIQRHEVPIPEHAAITFLRSAMDRQGNRYFVASGVAQQQLFLFDQDWKLLWSFPDDGEHDGIADVLLTDLAGDGQLQLVVG
jgi:thiol-disulfide isomerase/thioredoxin/outer membrane lipoprotein-sorting protein